VQNRPVKAIAIIPARLASNRLPGKVLREVGGKPLIRWVWERVDRARRVDEVWVSTDSPEIEAACREFTTHVHRTVEAHVCGTDRIAETARQLDADVFLNVQGDEPMMDPGIVDGVVALFDDPEVKLASAATPIVSVDQLVDPNIVKCVQDLRGDALFFSRAPIPWPREHPPQGSGPLPEGSFAFRHIGVYGYRAEDLQRLAALPPTDLERLESLEQLRAQEHGWKMRILVAEYHGIDIDTEHDLGRFRRALVEAGEIVE
jgi:3-deoxy-manno-octulosonate cytidylyltransferase (CMP-KDO synthetase)